jgi:putative transcription factor
MSEDWDAKLVIGSKRSVAKVTKKDSEINGSFSSPQSLHP